MPQKQQVAFACHDQDADVSCYGTEEEQPMYRVLRQMTRVRMRLSVQRQYGLWLVCVLLLTGCAARSIDPVLVPERGRKGVEQTTGYWLDSKENFRIRFGGEVEFGGRIALFEGLMRLDSAQHTARLVVLSQLGTKLFDVTVTKDGEKVHATLPGIGLSGMRKVLQKSVLRMLLGYQPYATDQMAIETVGRGETVGAGEGIRRTLRRCQEAGWRTICLENTFVVSGQKNSVSSVEEPLSGERADSLSGVLPREDFSAPNITHGISVPMMRTETLLSADASVLWKAIYSKHAAVGPWLVPMRMEYREPVGNDTTRVQLVFVSVAGGKK